MTEVEECSFRNEVSVFCSWDVKTIRVEKKRAGMEDSHLISPAGKNNVLLT